MKRRLLQSINIKIENDLIEKRLLKISHDTNKSISDLILELLYSHFTEREQSLEFSYKKLDPKEHRFKLFFLDENDDVVPTNPFLNIGDTSSYSKDLRNKAWRS
jgi:hypothetical protein